MNTKSLHDRLYQLTPEVPQDFHSAMERTLAAIVDQERQTSAAQPQTRAVIRRGTRRTLVLAALIVLLLISVAAAAIHWHVFDSIFGKTPQNADMVMQGNLYQTTVNNVEITIKEAGYDGMTLYLLYSYRMLDVDTPLGMYRDGGTGGEGIGEEDLQLLYDHNVGWWKDHIWFNGKCMDMPANSGGNTSGSATPGEIVEFQYWRLDNENVVLDGPTQISLPIGDHSWEQPDDFSLAKHPERYDENGGLLLPDRGMVTFTLDTSMRDRVVFTEPNIPAVLPELTAKVSKVAYTPIMMYVTLDMEVNPDKMAAFIAENGEGYLDENGVLLWPYGGMDVFDHWIYDLRLVDKNGAEVFPDMQLNDGFIYGNNGYGDHWAEFLFPYKDAYPDEMWLAPMPEGASAADLTLGVRVK